MISPKDLLLADITHAERLRQAEHAQVVQAAATTGRRTAAASRWWRVWRRGLGLDSARTPDLAATRV